ncbi:MAG: hypothetical protein OK449_06320 [Thaumarchaeota archaeon]|nr:hypothetical protein [Nitrososphaerota archaeon]
MSVKPTKKFQMYKRLYSQRQDMVEDAKKLGAELKFPEALKSKFGMTSAHSSFPGPIAKDVLMEMDKAGDEVRPLSDINDDLRDTVKDFYGDDYDAVPIASGEAALWIAFEALVTPSFLGRGDAYRCRYIAPFERHVSHQSGFGRPFPPKYKYVAADRYSTAGELGVEGKRLFNLDTVLVPFVGARYDAHGIKYYPTPLLSTADAKQTAAKFAQVAARHADSVSAFVSLAYDTPGYGYGEKAANGAPLFQTLVGKLAQEYDVPYIVDDAWGAPILGTDIRKTGASLILYSGDKVIRGPLSGLLIGKDDAIVPIRRAIGTHSHRYGNPSAYAKAMFSAFDPGREAIVAQAYILKKLMREPKQYTGPVDSTYKIVKEELANSSLEPFKKDIIVTKTYNNMSVEVNYDRTWKGDKMGVPIFTEEDSFAGTLPFEYILNTIGILPTITFDGNIMIAPGHGTVDANGALIEDRMRLGVKAIFGAMEIVSKRAGVLT